MAARRRCGPQVLDQRHGGRRTRWDRVRQRPDRPVRRVEVVAGPVGIAEQGRGECPAALRQVGQSLRRILGDLHGVEGPVGGPGDQEHVDQPDEPRVAEPGQLGQYLASERRLLVADDQHLDRAHQPVTRLARRTCSAALITPSSRSCWSAFSWAACCSGEGGAGGGAGGGAAGGGAGGAARRTTGRPARVRRGIRLGRGEPAAVVRDVAGHAGSGELTRHQDHAATSDESGPQDAAGAPACASPRTAYLSQDPQSCMINADVSERGG